MKLRNFLALMAVAFMATGFTSCDDDDDDDANVIPSANLSGDFYGVSASTVMGDTGYDSTCVARLKSQEDGKYTLVIPETTEKENAGNGMPGMPTIALPNLTLVPGAKGVYTCEAEEITVDVMAGKKAVISNLKFNLNNDTKTLTLSYGLQYGKMPLTIQYDFKTLLKNDFLVGTFMGVNSTIMQGETTPDSMNVASIEIQENGKYTLVLPEKSKSPLSFRGMEMPSDIRLTDLEIEGEGNKFSFSKAEATVKTPAMSIALKDVKGSIKGNKFELTYQLKPGKMPFYIGFSYEGGKIK